MPSSVSQAMVAVKSGFRVTMGVSALMGFLQPSVPLVEPWKLVEEPVELLTAEKTVVESEDEPL